MDGNVGVKSKIITLFNFKQSWRSLWF